MIDFSEIIGHEDIIRHFKSSIEMGKISQGYIINGETGSGKKTLAKALVKTLQCEEGKADPCNKCKSCLQCDTGNQPDIVWVTHDKPNVISVEEIRDQVNSDITIKPYSSRYKIYVIDDAQLLNVNAQNALLKTIEEAPSYAIIILLTNNIDKMLQTILSRCIVLNVKPVREHDILDYLTNELKLDKQKADFCMDFAQGNLGKAIRLATSAEYQEIKENVVRILRKIGDLTAEDIVYEIKNMEHYKLQVSDIIDLMMMWYRDILMLKVSNNPGRLMFKEYYSDIRKQSAHINYEGIENVLKAMDKAKMRLEANVNFDIVMELMLLTMKENC
jgi:DNA polymerase-3 subunit delta'